MYQTTKHYSTHKIHNWLCFLWYQNKLIKRPCAFNYPNITNKTYILSHSTQHPKPNTMRAKNNHANSETIIINQRIYHSTHTENLTHIHKSTNS